MLVIGEPEEIIILGEELLLGSGRYRECYQHPDNALCVVKIEKQKISKAQNSAHSRELRFYNALTDNKYFAKFIDIELTNLGPGLVFEKIQNADGSKAAKLMEFYSQKKLIPVEIYAQIIAIMKQLEKDRLLACSAYPENLLLVKDGDEIFVKSCDSKVIDIKQLIPLSKIGFFRKYKIRRRNRRLIQFYNKICDIQESNAALK